MWPCPPEGQDPAPPTTTQAPVSPQPGSLHKPLNQPHPQEADTKSNGNYEPAGCEKETPNTVSLKK